MRHISGVVDLIERANDATPFCPCGAHTTPTWRDGVVWLECSTLVRPPEGRLQRVINALSPHVHQEVIDLSEDALAA